MAKFGSVDEYVANLPGEQAGTMRSLIDAALAAESGLEVKLSWNVPQVHLGKHYVMGFSAAKAHLSVAPWSKDVMAAFTERLAALDPTDNMFRVPSDWSVDAVLIHDMVHARLTELGV